jgi:hypothetical protein
VIPTFRLRLAALLLAVSGVAQAQLGLSPNHFDLDVAAAGRTQSFRVTNFGTDPVRIRTELVAFDIREDGEVQEIAPNARSLERHLAISPIEFEIAGSGSQVVRFSVRPSQPLADGEYRGIVYFRLLRPEPVGAEVGRVAVNYRLGGAVYVQVGEPDRRAALTGVEFADGSAAVFSLQSHGDANARMKGRYVVWTRAAWGKGRELPPLPRAGDTPPDGLVMNGALPGRPVLPGKRVSYASPLSPDGKRLAPGAYVLQVVGRLQDDAIDRVVEFSVDPPPK